MKIGILSDTHGNLSATRLAARAMSDANVKAVFHCGDIGSMDVLAELAAVFEPGGIDVHAVYGNMDRHAADWKYFPSGIGVTLHGQFGDIDFNGDRIALLHSDDARRYRQIVASQEYAFVFSGHTHEVHDYMDGMTRCINPGTAGTGTTGTCAVLDLKTGRLHIIDI